MDYRRLGHTGLKVSRVCLGTMMFGRWGNADVDDCVRIVHARARRGHQLHRHRQPLLLGRVRGDRRQGGARPARLRRARHQGVHARRRRRARPRHVAPPHLPPGRGEPAPAGHRLDRSLPAAPQRQRHADRRDARRAHRPRPPGQGALPRRLDRARLRSGRSAVQRLAHGRVAVDQRARGLERFICTQPPYSIFSRDVERDVFPVCERFGFGAIVWSPLEGGWLAGRYRKGQAGAARLARRQRDRVRHVRARQLRSRQPARPAPPRRSSRSWCGWPTSSARRSPPTRPPGRCATPPSPAPSSARA